MLSVKLNTRNIQLRFFKDLISKNIVRHLRVGGICIGGAEREILSRVLPHIDVNILRHGIRLAVADANLYSGVFRLQRAFVWTGVSIPRKVHESVVADHVWIRGIIKLPGGGVERQVTLVR